MASLEIQYRVIGYDTVIFSLDIRNPHAAALTGREKGVDLLESADPRDSVSEISAQPPGRDARGAISGRVLQVVDSNFQKILLILSITYPPAGQPAPRSPATLSVGI